MTHKKTTLMVTGVLITAAVMVLAWRIWGHSSGNAGSRPQHPLQVDTVRVKSQPMPIQILAVGQVQPEQSVQIRPQVSGILKRIYFNEGQTVGKGQPLFLIEPAPFEAALAAARAAWENARLQRDRLKPLADKDYVTAQEYDNAREAADQARAALTQAKINLAYTDIRAPIAGRTGSTSVTAGNLVAPTDPSPLVVINQLQPILVQFSIPQHYLPELQHYEAQHSIRIFVTNEDGSGDLGSGNLVFIDNAITNDTGTVTLKARLPNEQERLWPGQYVGVRMQLAVQPDAVVVPQAAIQSGQNGNFVFVVQQHAAVIRSVQVDRQIGALAVISSGLTAGETVVVHVPRNLHAGLQVEAVNDGDRSNPSAQP
jgi:RND family efflux transporter MFP subunit